MFKILRWLLLLALVASSVSAGEKKPKRSGPPWRSSVQVDRKADEKNLLHLARINRTQARTAATQHARGFHFVKAKLENEKGNLIYEVNFRSGSIKRKVIVDAGNGKVLATRDKND